MHCFLNRDALIHVYSQFILFYYFNMLYTTYLAIKKIHYDMSHVQNEFLVFFCFSQCIVFLLLPSSVIHALIRSAYIILLWYTRLFYFRLCDCRWRSTWTSSYGMQYFAANCLNHKPFISLFPYIMSFISLFP